MPSQAPGDLATILGRNIRSARDAAGLTQRQLADRIGADSQQVSKWERGFNRAGDTNLIKIAAELDVDLPWLYTDHSEVAAA